MEHRFLWFMKTVAKTGIPILDCYEVNGCRVSKFYSETSREYSENPEVLELLGKIYREYSLIQRLMGIQNPPCYFFRDKEREPVRAEDLKRYVRSGIPKIQLIQVPKPCTKISEFTFRLSKGKLAVLYAADDKFKKSVKDNSIASQASLVSDSVIQALRNFTHKTVAQIELDFQLDDSNKLWLSNLRSLKFANQRNKTLLRTPKTVAKIVPEKKTTARHHRYLSDEKPKIYRSRRILRSHKSRTLSRQIDYC